MKLGPAPPSLLALCLILAAFPAVAQTVYSNGPTNGNTDAWYVNFGFAVSDTFNVALNVTTITGATFSMWLYPGDTLTSAELSITSQENGGTNYYTQVDNFNQSGCGTNRYGFDVCTETTAFSGPTLQAGTYWLNVQNASDPSGDPVYWDENSGPSSASNNAVGTIPSEAFTLFGTCRVEGSPPGECNTTTTTSTTTTGTVPEPATIMLFGSGILSLAGMVRRKLF
jgi:hypothetical protein